MPRAVLHFSAISQIINIKDELMQGDLPPAFFRFNDKENNEQFCLRHMSTNALAHVYKPCFACNANPPKCGCNFIGGDGAS